MSTGSWEVIWYVMVGVLGTLWFFAFYKMAYSNGYAKGRADQQHACTLGVHVPHHMHWETDCMGGQVDSYLARCTDVHCTKAVAGLHYDVPR